MSSNNYPFSREKKTCTRVQPHTPIPTNTYLMMCTWEYEIEICPRCGIGHKTNYHLVLTCAYRPCGLCSINNNNDNNNSNSNSKIPPKGNGTDTDNNINEPGRRPATCPRFESSRSQTAPIREMAQRCEDCVEAEKDEEARNNWLDAWFWEESSGEGDKHVRWGAGGCPLGG